MGPAPTEPERPPTTTTTQTTTVRTTTTTPDDDEGCAAAAHRSRAGIGAGLLVLGAVALFLARRRGRRLR
jgi:hypothetical protein